MIFKILNAEEKLNDLIDGKFKISGVQLQFENLLYN